ncbi:hypothetical protein [Vibrio jasicida]|uniref:hypothetical protein n=1 Tax=Vibrio jasicida TaxID=766224 RepID=UPI0005ED8185|nr:hypothetical protein [Vibrio jasicida]
MNKYLAIVVVAFFSYSVAAKVTYEDAVKSSKPYYDSVESVHIPVDRVGIPEGELGAGSPSIQMGKWAKSSYLSAHNQSIMQMSGQVLGTACTPVGVFASIGKEECTHVGNGDFDCKMTYSYYKCVN